MHRKGFIVLFLLSFSSLLISLKLFWNMGIFVDAYHTSPDVVNGGEFWLRMDWLRLLLLFILTVITGIGMFQKGTHSK
ncbi:hypothetical protein DX933_07620 [Ornithinibacillus gellani]|uniref:hypothetical protein n=1 Tax=Ornithinibacillus gellani TaxID=2293253 RepID=UPI000F471951|nr:hypothetical protein [Ornithinibacillus gellani]TQS75198.1 hypothetical protein DX933_07620 [Ornithinibacillus gellani]